MSSPIPGRQGDYVGERVSPYREIWRAAAKAIGASFSELSDDVWESSPRPSVPTTER